MIPDSAETASVPSILSAIRLYVLWEMIITVLSFHLLYSLFLVFASVSAHQRESESSNTIIGDFQMYDNGCSASAHPESVTPLSTVVSKPSLKFSIVSKDF